MYATLAVFCKIQTSSGCIFVLSDYTDGMATALQRRLRRIQEPAASSLVIRNVVVGGHRTSVRLEPVMWQALRDIAAHRKLTIHDLVTEIDRRRTASSLTAAIRVYIVDFYRAAALPAGDTPEIPRRQLPI
jgi:predicted DNA-binding ribbon-helix-helix protein